MNWLTSGQEYHYCRDCGVPLVRKDHVVLRDENAPLYCGSCWLARFNVVRRITREQAKRMGVPDEDLPPESKYRNEPTEVDGIRFDSIKEASRYQELRLLEKAGYITRLVCDKRQLRFPLEVNGLLVCVYEADFMYIRCEDGQQVVEDVKSSFTAKNSVYRLKRKLMKAIKGIEVLET